MAKEESKGQTNKKMTYEQLYEAAKELSSNNAYLKQQNQQLMNKIQELAEFQLFKRLDFLFKVLEVKEGLLPEEFVKKCALEIEGLMTLPPIEENEDKEEK